MIPPLIFAGKVSPQGQLTIRDRQGLLDGAKAFAGKEIELVLREPKRNRSNQANKYYWGVVIAMIAAELGYTKDEAHEAIAWKFLQEGEADAKLPKRKSTADLDQHAFEDYVSQVKQFAAEELGIAIPDPGQVDF